MGSIYLTNQLDTLRITSKLWSKSAYLEDSQKKLQTSKAFSSSNTDFKKHS